jgi:hypothetical protein
MVGKLVLAGVVLAVTPAIASADYSDVSTSAYMTRSPVGGGGATNMVVTLADNGPDGALDVTVDFTAPDGVEVTGANGCEVKGTYVHCAVGGMAVGETRKLVIALRGVTKGSYDLEAISYTGTYDPNQENSKAHAQLQVTSTAAAAPQHFTASSHGSSGTLPVRIRSASLQRIMKTGGVRTSVTPSGTGSIDVHCTISVPGHGSLTIAEQWRKNITGGRAVSLYLGTTSKMKRVLRSGFARAGRMHAVISVRFQSGSATSTWRRGITVVP